MIIVISYLESGSNYCRQCLMEQWDSDLEIEEFETREAAVSFITAEEVRQKKTVIWKT